jgi:hypothetical protein
MEPTVPAGVPPAGQRQYPAWGPTTWWMVKVLAAPVVLSIPGLVLVMVSLAHIGRDSGEVVAFGIIAAFAGLPPWIWLLVMSIRAARRRALIQHGQLALQEIMWSEFENRSGETITATRTFVMEYWLTLHGGKDRLKFVAGAKKIRGVPFPPAQGDWVLVAYHPQNPKRHELYGFLAADGRWWVPGKTTSA